MIAEHSSQQRSTEDRGGLSARLRLIALTLHRAAGLLDPWPGYAVPTDELMAMLAAERQAAEGSSALRMGLDELLERHRRLLAGPMRPILSGEWCG